MTDPAGGAPLAPLPERPRRLVYLGTPDVAVEPLQALISAGFDVALVITRADKRRGRGATLTPSPVKAAALALGLPVSHTVADAIEVEADLGVVVAFGQMIRRPVLEHLAMVNLHFSLLPRWRGAAPVERTILAGDTETGVCLMQLEEGLDTGPILSVERLAVPADATLRSLRDSLVHLGAGQLVRALRDELPEAQPQVGEPVYAAKLSADDHRLDWSRPAIELDRVVRLGEAWTTVGGRRLKVLAARPADGGERPDDLAAGALDGVVVGTGAGLLELITVQPEGRSAVPAAAWRNGARLGPDDRLGS
jgi:methionyl-tRNA formyltransferase